jgi:predicted amidohydrolase
MNDLKIAVIQMTSSQDKEKNLKQAEKLITNAVKKGAKFIALPEVFNFRGNLNEAPKHAEKIPGYSSLYIARLAKKHKVWILIGSMLEKGSSKPFNTSVLINPNGKIIAKYKKIHLFDIKLKGKEILESKRNQAGELPKIVSVNGIKCGMSICYDLRFPELYRYYSKKGVKIIFIPSSFTKPTGEAHWHTLVKARAIENLAYVVAPNQAGVGSAGVRTYGHSLVVDPWGNIMAEGPPDKEGVIFADIDLNHQNKIRQNLPALEHRKL